MPATLLKHHLYSYRNRLFREVGPTRFLNRDIGITILSLGMMYGIYVVLLAFLKRLAMDADYGTLLVDKLLDLSLWGFFVLLLISNFISAIGNLFSAKDLELFLLLPISQPRLYFARLVETLANSSWMFLFFGFPAMIAYIKALHLPWAYLGLAAIITVPLLVIPTAIGMSAVIIFVNIVPAHRMKDMLTVVACICVAFFLLRGQYIPAYFNQEQAQMRDLVYILAIVKTPAPEWAPSSWAAGLLASSPNSMSAYLLYTALLASTALGTTAISYLLFDALFSRGWNLSLHSTTTIGHGRVIRTRVGHLLLPYAPQFRALIYKEARTFVRDASQSLQLLMLLMLTFVYLYNFRALQSISSFHAEVQSWWEVILCISNITLGACIISAIATRFVFPTVSLEGRGYWVLRCAPLSIERFLWQKFFIWLLPISIVTLTLFVSGAWAIAVQPGTVIICGVLAGAVSIGVVGIGVGVGAVYSKFEWDNPTEVAASFGSLVFMVLCLVVLFFTIIPASILVAITSVHLFTQFSGQSDYYLLVALSIVLAFLINIVAARHAISAGAQSLRDREK